MFKKVFEEALQFYFFEADDPFEIPERFKPTKCDDGLINVWAPVDGKGGCFAHKTYDPKRERFLTTTEYWRRVDNERREKLGSLILTPMFSKEWEEFQEWKRGKDEN